MKSPICSKAAGKETAALALKDSAPNHGGTNRLLPSNARTMPFFSRLPLVLIVCLVLLPASLTVQAQTTPLKQFSLPSLLRSGVSIQELLPAAIPEVTTDCVSMAGPARHTEPASTNQEVVWLFLHGSATLRTKDNTYQLRDETIARAPLGWSWDVEVSQGESLLAVRIRKQLSASDKAEYGKYPQNNAGSYVKKFSECTPYKEAIKSPKTVSRTLLPENVVPRMAAGTVETTGPDRVAPHKHPMLEQLFLGLQGNDCIVTADEARVSFPPLSILHIPLGSNHGAEVAEGKRLYYVWLDFFGNKEGQEWLKMHTPVDKAPSP
jgi:hypothetical protein